MDYYEYKYGTDGLGMPSITKKFGVRQDGTFGELTTNQFDGTTNEFSQSNVVSPVVDSTFDKKELGLFDMNDRGLTRFGSYLNDFATGADIGLGIWGGAIENKKLKIAEENAELNKQAKEREFAQQDAQIQKQKQFEKNMTGNV